MTLGIMKAPARAALGSTLRTGAVGLGLMLYVAAMVSLPILGVMSQRAERVAPPNAPTVWDAQGVGNDTTIVMEARSLRAYVVSWEAECLVTMRMNRWSDKDGTSVTFPMGRARSRTVSVTLPPGGYFFDADARCPWVVRVR